MNKRKFVQTRRPEWKTFRKLLDRVEARSAKRLSPTESEDFSRLLRELSNDLAVVRSREWGRELEEFLNHLVTRGYNNFYSAPGRFRESLQFVAAGFPQLLRSYWKHFTVAWCLFFLPLMITWAVVQNDPSTASAILPADQLEGMDEAYSRELYGRGEDEVVVGYFGERSAMSGFYVYHNGGIALQCFALGILAGVGTLYTLLFNGVVLGASSAYIISQSDAHREHFLSFAVTHGSFELTAIAIAGCAGLILGEAVVHREGRTLLDSLRVKGIDSVKLGIGAVLMLAVAAGLEGYWSPSPIPATIKYIVGIGCWVFVYSWLFLGGRWT